jgi:uncharacterized membrane protein YhfC
MSRLQVYAIVAFVFSLALLLVSFLAVESRHPIMLAISRAMLMMVMFDSFRVFNRESRKG